MPQALATVPQAATTEAARRGFFCCGTRLDSDPLRLRQPANSIDN